MKDRRVSIQEFATSLGVNTDKVHEIHHEHLCMMKVSARGVPCLLGPEKKADGTEACRELL